jgi:uncharacterized protein YqeY
MSLLIRIKADQLQARKGKMTMVAALLTTLIGEAEAIGKNAGNRATTDDEVLALIAKFIKNLDETIRLLPDTDERKLSAICERTCLMQYQPRQLTEAELKDHVRAIHAGLLGMQAKASMGDIIGVLKSRFGGQYDGKLASAIVKAELAS